MTIAVNLEAAARVETERISQARVRAAFPPELPSHGDVVALTLRKPVDHLVPCTVLVFMRTRVVDGSGRLIEDFLIPLQIRCSPSALRRMRGVHRWAQKLLDACLPSARSTALAEVAVRIDHLAAEYGRGLSRARAREAELGTLIEADRQALIQPGLFDRRGLGTGPSVQTDGRRQTLDNAASLLVAQQSEATLLLIVGSGA
jgi:hypothetical protein